MHLFSFCINILLYIYIYIYIDVILLCKGHRTVKTKNKLQMILLYIFRFIEDNNLNDGRIVN